jgi:tyrosine-protein kinase Etk/Wzc
VPQMQMPVTASSRAYEVDDMGGGGGVVSGEMSIETVAETLVAGGVSRAVFLSPEGDEGAASAILVSREIADAGLRVLLLDLTSTNAATRPMLESDSYAGVTNLLSSESQFTDVIHADLYSDCHIMPVGTADPERAMRAVDRLPIILNSLETAYDLVVVECGAAELEDAARLISDNTRVVVSIIEQTDADVADTLAALDAAGYRGVLCVTPVGHLPSRARETSSSAA